MARGGGNKDPGAKLAVLHYVPGLQSVVVDRFFPLGRPVFLHAVAGTRAIGFCNSGLYAPELQEGNLGAANELLYIFDADLYLCIPAVETSPFLRTILPQPHARDHIRRAGRALAFALCTASFRAEHDAIPGIDLFF